ncbi:hypothetical protein [uncultured Catenibacterium sp.]|uniref:hypothetical protein n=1 Tax=uncultured Catenibacterium sp. TaxID=286142 RepID=UPI00260056E3|nr:hypothetical protein [uncultured Catenibacterium sp.]
MDLSLDKFKKQGNDYLVPEDVFKELIKIYKTNAYLTQMDKRIEDIKSGKRQSYSEEEFLDALEGQGL